ncbi:MAG: AAA family ATPase [Deltaproteobacteria bacterium]|nr:AAA family ATPase [Deltaproteobacteria bacterium]MBI3293389.1 AAA family ATPase [Deltaproteobacteria bacterium]
MPHLRQRQIKKSLQKALSYWPAVAVLGPRQCGKSTFLRDLIWKPKQFTYLSLDQIAHRSRAQSNPELFLSGIEIFPLVIDEAQKAPPLFDEIKAVIDRRRIPGRFILSGSVEFSKKTAIKESLTGRVATLRMDAMTFRETAPKTPGLDSVLHYLEWGGMPGVCFARDQQVRGTYWRQWIETLCERDLRNFLGGGRLSSDLAYRVLECTAKIPFPTRSNIAAELRVDGRRVQSHLDALESLFILNGIHPSPKGIGKMIYLPFDSGLAHSLGANLRRRWQSWFALEFLNQDRFRQGPRAARLAYYMTSRGSFIDFCTKKDFYLYSDQPSPDRSCLMTVHAALRKAKEAKFWVCLATEAPTVSLGPGVRSLPWPKIATSL